MAEKYTCFSIYQCARIQNYQQLFYKIFNETKKKHPWLTPRVRTPLRLPGLMSWNRLPLPNLEQLNTNLQPPPSRHDADVWDRTRAAGVGVPYATE